MWILGSWPTPGSSMQKSRKFGATWSDGPDARRRGRQQGWQQGLLPACRPTHRSRRRRSPRYRRSSVYSCGGLISRARGMDWLRSVHFYRKVPADLTEATVTGGAISLISTIVMVYLFCSNFLAYLAVDMTTSIVVFLLPVCSPVEHVVWFSKWSSDDDRQ